MTEENNHPVDKDPEGCKLPPNVQTWLKALRSGHYQQGRERLREEDRFCCLGVVCDVFNPEAWEGNFYIDKGGNSHIWNLPPEVIEWLGIGSSRGNLKNWVYVRLPDYPSAVRVDSLTTLNDFTRFDFDSIADFIENNWELLKADD